jgi:cysteine desulfurase/selenocysteine lyase
MVTQTGQALPTEGLDYRNLFSVDQLAPRLDGNLGPYINFDNAASTPPLKAVEAALDAFMPWYSSVHRGNGFKSRLATHAYERARQVTLGFVGADPSTHVCIFGKNTTEATNKLARRFPFQPGRDVVLVSQMEHHSNDLPYRPVAKVVHVHLLPTGELDESDFDQKLAAYAGRVALVAISGASNVSGYINPCHRLAEKAHAAGAQILVDCAQLAPHRAVTVGALDDPAHFDYVAISGHKLYAPYGTGALIGRRDTFEQGEPDLRGGGTVEFVSEETVDWSAPPDRDEAGSPNVVGAVALAAAIQQLQAVGMEAVAAHEAELTAHALRGLARLDSVEVLGNPDHDRAAERLGVIPFNLKGLSHFLVAAILGHEFGIGVRNGCFCAHPYVMHLLDQYAAAERVRHELLAHDRRQMPGLVRASFGLYNTTDEVDIFLEALEKIARGEYQGRYQQDQSSGDYTPVGWQPEFEKYFSL